MQKSYCVLNKQYSRAEYMKIVPRIIAQMQNTGECGRFFPPQFSSQTYQESMVHEFLEEIPLDVARRRGYWVAPEEPEKIIVGAIPASSFLDAVDSAAVTGLASKSIICERSGGLYKFKKPELEFYLHNALPLPRRHWNERLQEFVGERELIEGL